MDWQIPFFSSVFIRRRTPPACGLPVLVAADDDSGLLLQLLLGLVLLGLYGVEHGLLLLLRNAAAVLPALLPVVVAAAVVVPALILVLILVLVAVFGPSILTVTVVIGILGWTAIAKLIYGNVLSIREREYIQAAKTSGTSTWTILFSEVLPNAIPPVWANISFRVAGAILTESSLSFLGMGVQTPQASWGNIIYAAQNLMVLTARPWVWIPPGVCIILVVIGFNFIGEGVRDALDPKTK